MNIDLFKSTNRQDQYIGYVIFKDDGRSVWDGVTYPSEESAKEVMKWDNITGYHVEVRAFFYEGKSKRNDKF